MLSRRIISSVIFFAIFFLGLFNPWFGWVLPLLVTLATVKGLTEFLRFGQQRPPTPMIWMAVACALALLSDAYWWQLRHALLIMGLQTVLSMGLGTLRLEKNFAETAGKCLIGTLYVTLPLALIMEIWRAAIAADNHNGPHYLIFLVLGTQASDVGAYCVGRLCGRHKLAPNLSPGKTVEGFVGGVVFTLLVAVGFKIFWNNMDRIFGWREILFLALLFGVIGPVGDLTESWFKRNSAVKDSGHTFTGHGGMLDIIDSLLFTAIFYYGYLWLAHPDIITHRSSSVGIAPAPTQAIVQVALPTPPVALRQSQ
jgi:phosphatidate cytidylyltransferase